QRLRGRDIRNGFLERAIGAAQRGLQRGDAGIGERLESLRVLELESDGFERVAIEHEGVAIEVGAVQRGCLRCRRPVRGNPATYHESTMRMIAAVTLDRRRH